MRDYAQFSFVWSLLYPLIIALCSYHLSQNEGIPEQKMTFQITLFLMLPFLLEEGEEDKKDTSKNPHLGEFTVMDYSKEYLMKNSWLPPLLW